MAKATIDFLGRKYSYFFKMPMNPTKHKLALAIAISKGKKEGVRKYTGLPKDYNLIMELLQHNGRTVYPDGEPKVDYFQDATQRNSEEQPVKINCCSNVECKQCNGHGFYYERLMWRVGITQNHTHIIDIDGNDINNCTNVKSFYENVLNCKFKIIKSNKGFWLISDKKYNSLENWKYDHCRVLYPDLFKENLDKYISGLDRIDKDENGNFKKMSVDDFKKSKFYTGYGTFDIMFTLLSIKRERSTLRISKKRPNDKIEIICGN